MHDLECARSLTRLALTVALALAFAREGTAPLPADSAPLLHLLTNDGGS
ncbi:hypothetical protein [Streptomyces mirabilis]